MNREKHGRNMDISRREWLRRSGALVPLVGTVGPVLAQDPHPVHVRKGKDLPRLRPRSWDDQKKMRTGVCFSQDGSLMFTSCDKDLGFRVWDAKTLKERYRVSGFIHFNGPRDFTLDGSAFLCSGSDRSVSTSSPYGGVSLRYEGPFVSLNRVKDGGELRIWKDFKEGPCFSGLVDSDRRLMTLDRHHRFILWNVSDGRELSRRDGCADAKFQSMVKFADIDRAGRRIVSIDDAVEDEDRLKRHFGAEVRVWDIDTGRVRYFPAPPADSVTKGREGIDKPIPVASLQTVTISPDGEHVFAVRWDGAVVQWKWNDGSIVRIVPSPSGTKLFHVGFRRDDSFIIALGDGEEFYLLDQKDLSILQTVRCPAGTSLRADAIQGDRLLFAAQGEFANKKEPGTDRLMINPENGGFMFGTPVTIDSVPLSFKIKSPNRKKP